MLYRTREEGSLSALGFHIARLVECWCASVRLWEITFYSTVKPVSATSKKMNSTKESEAKVKSTPKITSPPLNDKPAALDSKAAAELAESSDSYSENKPQIQASTLKPAPGAEETSASSSTSESEEEEETKQVTTKTVATRSTPAKTPTTKKATSNGKAIVTNDVSGSSDDETDIDKPVVILTPRPAGPSSVQTAKLKAQTPPTAPQPEAESSSGSSESESEEESVKQKMPTPVIAASQVKIDTPLTKAITTSQTDSSLGKTQNHTKTGVSESSDDSDSEEEPEHQKVAALVHSTPKKGVSPKKVATPASRAKASKPETTAVDSKPTGSGESGSSDSDSHSEEEVSQKIPTAQRTSTGKKQPVTPLLSTPVAVGKAKTPLQATQPADDNSETDSSDSDDEPLAKKIAATHLATGKKQPMTTLLSTPAGKSKTPLQAPPPADDGSETDSSDSDDELLKIATPCLVSTGKKQPATPSLSTPAGKPKTPLQTPKSEEDSSETDSSDSDDKKLVKGSSSVPVRNSVPSTPSTAVKQSALDSDADSESSDSSDSEEKTPVVSTPKPATPVVAAKVKLQTSTASQPVKESSSDDSALDSDEPVKTVPKASAGTTVPVKVVVAAPVLHPEDSSETNGSDEEEEPKPVVATQKPATPAVTAKGKPQTSAAPQPDEKSSSDDGESDSDEGPVKTVLNASLKVAPPVLKSAMRLNTAAKVGSPAKAFTSTKAAAAAESSDSTDSSDVEEEQTESQKLPTKQKLGSPTPSNNIAKGKSSRLTKTPPVGKLAPADASESSDTDSDEEETRQVLTPTPSTIKTKDGKVTGKLAKTPTPSSIKKVKATSAIKTPVKVREESTESVGDSSEKPAVKRGKKEATPAAVTSTRKASKSIKTRDSSVIAAPKAKVMSPIKTPVVSKQKTAAESSSDSSDSEEDSKVPKPATPKPAAPASVGKGKKAAPPPLSKESSSDGSDSGSEEEPVKSKAEASASMAAKQGLPATPTKMKVPSSAKTPVLAKPPAEETSSATSSDSEDEVPVQTPTLPLKIKSPVKKDSGKVEKKATRAVGDKSSHELERSQPLFEEPPPAKPSTKKRKRDSQVEEQSVSDTEKVGKAKKKKSEGKVKPDAAPTQTPPAAPEPVPPAPSGAMLDSEEETVLALLEGRNPKKAKRIKSSKKDIVASSANTLAAIPEQDNNVAASLNPSVWVPDSPSSGDEADVNLNVISPSAQEIAKSPAKNVKSGKKRKISPEDGHSKLKAKSAKKKEKKEKKLKSGLEGEIVTSKKDKQKSEKKKPKKKKSSKNKEEKKSKKLTHSITAPVAESTDSGIGLLSKPKKKRKTEGLG